MISIRWTTFEMAILSVMILLAGCERKTSKVEPPQPPAVPISQPIERQVTDFVEFTGRIDAIQSANIVPRVTGYLIKMPFAEGSEVKTGDLLFEIDPRPYQAQLDEAVAQVKLYDAQLRLARTTAARDTTLTQTPGAISNQQLDQDRAAVDQAEASVRAAQASVEVYKLNLSFTKVTAPIDGQVSRYYLTTGNLVNQDQTLLTTVVSLDPIYAYFDVDETTLLRLRHAITEGQLPPAESGHTPVAMGLQGEEGFPRPGTVDFVNNQVNPTTGSILVRGVFPNPKPEHGRRILSPGMFARIRLPIGPPHKAVLVADQAIGSDQGLKYVYVVDAEKKVQYRRITTGALEPDGLRVITEGVKPGEWVVVGALQQIRPRMEVRAEKTPMPVIATHRQDPDRKDVESPQANQPGPGSTSATHPAVATGQPTAAGEPANAPSSPTKADSKSPVEQSSTPAVKNSAQPQEPAK